MPIGMPGCPELAFWTASMASARIALAICGTRRRARSRGGLRRRSSSRVSKKGNPGDFGGAAAREALRLRAPPQRRNVSKDAGDFDPRRLTGCTAPAPRSVDRGHIRWSSRSKLCPWDRELFECAAISYTMRGFSKFDPEQKRTQRAPELHSQAFLRSERRQRAVRQIPAIASRCSASCKDSRAAPQRAGPGSWGCDASRDSGRYRADLLGDEDARPSPDWRSVRLRLQRSHSHGS